MGTRQLSHRASFRLGPYEPRRGGEVFPSKDPSGRDGGSLTCPTCSARLAAGLPVSVGEEGSGFTLATQRNTMVYTTVSADVRAWEGGGGEVR